MADVLAVAAMTALFLVTVLFVVACDKLIGRDEVALAEETGSTVESEPRRETEAA